MQTIRRYIDAEPVLFKAVQNYVKFFLKVPDPIIAVTSKIQSVKEKIAWTLLGSALFQGCSYTEIHSLMESLIKKFPSEKLWTLPVPKSSEIDSIIEKIFGSKLWALKENAAGIFWSVGLFVRRHENLEEWVKSRTPEKLWRDLGEIYFMGKHKPRPKACATVYRLSMLNPMGLGLKTNLHETKKQKWPAIPLSMGARRFLSIIGPAKEGGFSVLSNEEKQKMMNDFCCVVNSKNPIAVAHAMQFYLEEGKDDFICRAITNHCKKCPLYEFCNYGENRCD